MTDELKCETCGGGARIPAHGWIYSATLGQFGFVERMADHPFAPPLTADVQEAGYTLDCSECQRSFAAGVASQTLRSHKDTHATSCSFKVVWS